MTTEYPKNLFFIDSNVVGYESLLRALPFGSLWFILQPEQDGVLQIASITSEYSKLDSIQIISHGSTGALRLGNVVLDSLSLAEYQKELLDIGRSLVLTGDIRLYGCNVAQGEEGRAFIESLALITDAEVTASSDLTGAQGNWSLEISTGMAESVGLDPALIDFAGTLANTAPVLTPAAPALTSINENDTANAGQSVASILGGAVSDGDVGSLKGLALYAVSGSFGKWQFSTNAGSNWSDVGAVSVSTALLLRSTDFIRWLPDGTNGTTATISYYGWDQTFGAAANKMNVASRGGATAFSEVGDVASVVIVGVTDDAPVLAIPIADQQVQQDTIFSYTIPAGTYTDPDLGDSFSYSARLSGGALLPSWLLFDGATRTFNGTPLNADVGNYDVTVNATDSTGLIASDNFRITVNNVNDAPVLTPATPQIAGFSENDLNNWGKLVSAILQASGNALSDVDLGALNGIAVYATTGSYGKWQYSIDGVAWQDVSAVSDSSALLLRGSDYLRWIPDGIHGGTPTFSYYGWDRTAGSAGARMNVAVRGGTSAFSQASDTATYVIESINDAPVYVSGQSAIITPIGISDDYGKSVAVQSNGKILVAGYTYNGSNYDVALVRYNQDGSLDASFNGTGIVTTALGSSHDYGYSVAIQADGKIVVAGSSYNGSNDDFALVRYNTDGSLDASFNGNGKLTTSLSANADVGQDLLIQPDNKIVVAGYVYNGSSYDFALARFNTNGTLDTTFNTTGKVIKSLGSYEDKAYSVALQSDGKILVAGTSFANTTAGSSDFALVRYNTDGSLDTSFNGSGFVTTSYPTSDYANTAYSVAIQPDNKILVAGSTTDNQFTLVRYNANGGLDTSFNGTGVATKSFGSYLAYGYSIGVQPDGKILVGGYVYSSGVDANNQAFGIVRFKPDGSLDTSFNGNGTAIRNVGPGADQAFSIALEPDGTILLAGNSVNANGNEDFSLIRLNSDGSFATSLLNGRPYFVENGSSVILDNDVQVFDSELSAANNYAGATLSLLRHGGANPDDVFNAVSIGGALAEGSNVVVSGVVIGTVTKNSGGSLLVNFVSAATQTHVNTLLQSIAYRNGSENPPASVQIDWNFSDGNAGLQGSGGSLVSAGSTIVGILQVNDAPALTPSAPVFAPISEDTVTSAGVTVSSLLQESLADLDLGAGVSLGIALYGVTGNNGKWQYSVDAGSNWIDVATVSTTSALLLRGSDYLKWLPDGTNGTTATIAYSGWDQSGGVAGSKVSVLVRGGATPFSTSTDMASLNVTSVNDAPYLVNPIPDLVATEEIAFSYMVPIATFSEVDLTDSISGYFATLINGDPLPMWLSFDSATRSFYGTPSNADVGNYDIRLTTYDNTYATNSDIFRLVVNNVNDLPTGNLVIRGNAFAGRVLSVVNEFSDPDGLTGALTYTWKANGTIVGYGSSYTLIQADVGKQITVTGVYIDNFGTHESVTSTPVKAVNAPSSAINFANNSGLIVLDLGGYEYTQDAVKLPNGKFLLIGTSYATNDGIVVRFNPDGSLDTEFNGVGYKIIDMLGGKDSLLNGYLEASGKVVVTGMVGDPSESNLATSSRFDIGIARLNTDGSFDNTFGVNGRAVAGYVGSATVTKSVQLPNGQYLLAGNVNASSGASGVGVALFNSDGSLDTSFGNGGKTNPNEFSGFNLWNLLPTNNGKILLTGLINNGSDFGVIQLTSRGVPDASFGLNGKVSLDLGSYENYLPMTLVQGDGKIILIGASNGDTVLARLNANGTLDTSFDTDGKLLLNYGLSERPVHAVLQSDGKLLLVIESYNVSGPSNSVIVTRINGDGSVDTGFGTQGKFVLSGSVASSYSAKQIELEPDGKILLAGAKFNQTTTLGSLMVTRLNSDGSLDNSYSGDGIYIDTNILGGSGLSDIISYDNGAKIFVGNTAVDSFNMNLALISLNANGNPSTGGQYINTSPTGTVSISGSMAQGKTLLASNSLVDPDGLGLISYIWRESADGVVWTTVATGPSFTIGPLQAGKRISVEASFNDDHGERETVVSAHTRPAGGNLHGTDEADTILGVGAQDHLFGGAGDDSLIASVWSLPSLLNGGAGNDLLQGVTRADIAEYSGNRAEYGISVGDDQITVQGLGSRALADGADIISGINIIKFADCTQFILGASDRVALNGTEENHLISVTESKLYNGTKLAETFAIAQEISPMILAGEGGTVRLNGSFSDYTYAALGSQLQIFNGNYMTTVNLGGTVHITTDTGSADAHLAFLSGTPSIILGTQTIGAADFDSQRVMG